jgi:two-component system KDP operon response regulator KdpE
MDNKPCVLIVEDEHNILGFMRTVLQANGYRVIEAQDAAQALQMLRPICRLMILDLGLPDMDGMNVISPSGPGRGCPPGGVGRDQERDKVMALDRVRTTT